MFSFFYYIITYLLTALRTEYLLVYLFSLNSSLTELEYWITPTLVLSDETSNDSTTLLTNLRVLRKLELPMEPEPSRTNTKSTPRIPLQPERVKFGIFGSIIIVGTPIILIYSCMSVFVCLCLHH